MELPSPPMVCQLGFKDRGVKVQASELFHVFSGFNAETSKLQLVGMDCFLLEGKASFILQREFTFLLFRVVSMVNDVAAELSPDLPVPLDLSPAVTNPVSLLSR